MGDVSTHREIHEAFIQPHLPADVDPVYVEFGNYLTDVSQFVDPWAHIGGKKKIWREEIAKGFSRIILAADIFKGDNYLDFLLGDPAICLSEVSHGEKHAFEENLLALSSGSAAEP